MGRVRLRLFSSLVLASRSTDRSLAVGSDSNLRACEIAADIARARSRICRASSHPPQTVPSAMLWDLACIAGTVWSGLAAYSIVQQKPITVVAAEVQQRLWASRRILWTGRFGSDGETTPAAASSAERDQLDACRELQVSRQIVRRSPHSNSGSGAAVPPLTFALELAWSAPESVLQQPRVTYQLTLQPLVDEAAQPQQPAEDQPQQADGAPQELPAPLQFTLTVAAPSSADASASTASGHDAASLPHQISTTGDDGVVFDLHESPLPPQSTSNAEVTGSQAAPSADDEEMDTSAPPEGSADASLESEHKSASRPRGRKRKAGVSTTDANKAKPSSKARGGRRTASRSDISLEDAAGEANTESDAARSSELDTEEDHKQAVRPRKTYAAVAAASSAPASSESSSPPLSANSTFERPAFLFTSPAASAYAFTVTAQPLSKQSLTVAEPEVLHFRFVLPPLLFLLQSHPSSSSHASRVLAAFEAFVGHVRVQDEIAGVEWTGLEKLIDTEGSYLQQHREVKRAMNVLGKLADLPCLVRSLAAHSGLLHAIKRRAQKRIAHLEEKAHGGAGHAGEEGGKRRKSGEHGEHHAAEQDDTHMMDVDSGVHAANADSQQQQQQPELLEPILENILWFLLAILRLTQPHVLAASRPEIARANHQAVEEFLKQGEGAALLLLVCSMAHTVWFEAYEEEVVAALVHLFTNYQAEISPAEQNALLFHLLHQSTFGTPTTRALLQQSPISKQLRNPFGTA
jgi:hypothetical protein